MPGRKTRGSFASSAWFVTSILACSSQAGSQSGHTQSHLRPAAEQTTQSGHTQSPGIIEPHPAASPQPHSYYLPRSLFSWLSCSFTNFSPCRQPVPIPSGTAALPVQHQQSSMQAPKWSSALSLTLRLCKSATHWLTAGSIPQRSEPRVKLMVMHKHNYRSMFEFEAILPILTLQMIKMSY